MLGEKVVLQQSDLCGCSRQAKEWEQDGQRLLQGLEVLHAGCWGRLQLRRWHLHLLWLRRLPGQRIAAAAAASVAAVRGLGRARPQMPELLVDGHDAV